MSKKHKKHKHQPKARGQGICHESHPALSLGGELEIYGGSCNHPKVEGADIYIGFDRGMASGWAWPWDGGHEVLFAVSDMDAPADPEKFKKLVDWTIEQIKAGKVVHAGCIGGHGRTGTFFAAIVAKLELSDDPISYVRQKYCTRAVESERQIKFLVTHFGCKSVAPTKGTGSHSTTSTAGNPKYDKWLGDWRQSENPKPVDTDTGWPVSMKGNMWGTTKVLNESEAWKALDANPSRDREKHEGRALVKGTGPGIVISGTTHDVIQYPMPYRRI